MKTKSKCNLSREENVMHAGNIRLGRGQHAGLQGLRYLSFPSCLRFEVLVVQDS